ncbi:MAG TPA: Rv3235 family protein [Micromonosporaceae bacterium]
MPPLDPPFDDEAAPPWTGPHQLALDFPTASRRPGNLRPRTGTRPGQRRSAPSLDPRPAPPPGTPVGASVEARQAARRFLLACLEIFNGYRTAAQVRPLAGRGELHEVVKQLNLGLERLTALRRRTGDRRQPVRLRRIRICEPRSGVAEAAAVLDIGGHARAFAFRVERRHGSWVATALRLL